MDVFGFEVVLVVEFGDVGWMEVVVGEVLDEMCDG